MSPTALDLWEAGAGATPAGRALLLLEAAGHGGAATWSVGARDRALLTQCCPERLAALAQCPGCGELLDVDVDVDARAFPELAATPASVTVERDGHRVHARAPSAGDLAALPADGPVGRLAAGLLRACVRAAEHDGRPVAADALPDEVLRAVEEALAAAEPGGELSLGMTCAACGVAWDEVLDPVRFAWARVEDGARALAADVHALACAYGWGESEILALSPPRRRLYLSAVWQ